MAKFGKVDLQGPPSECKLFSVGEKRIIFADVMKIINTEKLSVNCKEYNIVIKKQEFHI